MTEDKDSKYKYKIKYHMKGEFGEFNESDVESEHDGLCDAFMFVSICLEDEWNGFASMVFCGKDGITKNHLSDDKMFEVFMSLADKMARSENLHPYKRSVAMKTLVVAKELFSTKFENMMINN